MNPLWPYNSQGVHAGGGRGRRGVGEGEERIRIYARAEISLLSVRLFMEKVCSHDRNCWMREECGSRFCIHNHSSPAPYSAVHPSHRSGLHKCKTRQSRFLSVSFASLIRHCARSQQLWAGAARAPLLSWETDRSSHCCMHLPSMQCLRRYGCICTYSSAPFYIDIFWQVFFVTAFVSCSNRQIDGKY